MRTMDILYFKNCKYYEDSQNNTLLHFLQNKNGTFFEINNTQATHVLLQDDASETDSRTYSQMRTRSVSRVNTHSILSMQQQSSNYKISQSHMPQQMINQSGNRLPQVDEDEVEMVEDQEQEQDQEHYPNFDEQMNNRKEFNRKNDPKHTVETAGFGNKFNKANNMEQDIENSIESEEDDDEYQEESSGQPQQQMGKSISKGSQSPENSGTQQRNTQQMAQKVTFINQQQSTQQQINSQATQQQINPQVPNVKPRTSIKRATTRTNNTAIVFDNVLAALQENQNLIIEFPIITFPSLGDFDKIMTFRKYFPQHNISAVLKLVQIYQKQKEHLPTYSKFSFLYTAIRLGLELEKKILLEKKQEQQMLDDPKLVNKPQKYFKRQATQRQN